MEKIQIENINFEVSRIGLGTWAIGGWAWGGTDESESIKTIHAALDKGINLIDTAPVYGFGKSEEIVGKAINAHGKRDEIAIATKVGIDWTDNGLKRNSSKERLAKELEDSLKRLQTDYIDIYQIHWPDESVPFEETAEVLNKFMEEGKIRAIGVSNYSVEQMDAFRKVAPIHTNQPPYNLFERDIENDIMPYCKENNIKTLTYGSLCRGLLSGKMTTDRKFEGDDIRKVDPKFEEPRFSQYLSGVEKLKKLAEDTYGKSILQLAVRWVLDQGSDIALWGARNPGQLDGLEGVWNWNLEDVARLGINNIINLTIKDPVGPEFMAPPISK